MGIIIRALKDAVAIAVMGGMMFLAWHGFIWLSYFWLDILGL